jgi:hypothetical protein
MFETTLRHPIIASKNTFFWFKIGVLENIFLFNEGEKCVKKLILKRRKYS